MLRPQKLRSTHILIIALAASDILFSLVIHPMLIATSFGANVSLLFSSSGTGRVFLTTLDMLCPARLQLVWIWSNLLWVPQHGHPWQYQYCQVGHVLQVHFAISPPPQICLHSPSQLWINPKNSHSSFHQCCLCSHICYRYVTILSKIMLT